MTHKGRAQRMLEHAAGLHTRAVELADEIQRFDHFTQQADVRDLVVEAHETLLAIARILTATSDQFEIPGRERLLASTQACVRDLARLLRSAVMEPFDGVLDVLSNGRFVIVDREGGRVPPEPDRPASGTCASRGSACGSQEESAELPRNSGGRDCDRRIGSEERTSS